MQCEYFCIQVFLNQIYWFSLILCKINSIFSHSGSEEYASCKLIAIPGRYDYKPYAFGFQKYSPYLPIFNYYIKAMQEKGSMDQVLEKHAPAPQICPDLTGKALGFNSCISAFLILMGGATAGLILLAIELVSKKTGSNWAWLEWYGKKPEMKVNVQSSTIQDESAGNEEENGGKMNTLEAEEPSSTLAWTQAGEDQQPTITTADVEIQG